MKSKSAEFKFIYLLWLLPGPFFYVLYRLSFNAPQFVETVYSQGIFRYTNQTLSTITGLLPVSLGELLLYAFLLFIAAFLILMVIRSILAKRNWYKTLAKRLFLFICICSFLYASFIGLWAFNYARQPLGESLGLNTSPAAVNELFETSKALAAKASALREEVREDEDGIFVYSKEQAMKAAKQVYNIAADTTGYDFLSGSFGRAKPVLSSAGLSKVFISGVYFPFTAEANINSEQPNIFFAASVLHEAAHQRGFAREDEANFLAYYVSSFSSDHSIKYSGTMLALIHTMNKLYNENEDLYFEVKAAYTAGMIRDLDSNNEFWKTFEGKASEVSEQVNNTYLKSNMQTDGVKSYGRMVDLLIGLWRSDSL